MFDEFKELMQELNNEEVARALRRMFNYRKLVELHAPANVIDISAKLLTESRLKLGLRFDIIEKTLLPRFTAYENEMSALNQAWEAKCLDCKFWRPEPEDVGDYYCLKHTFQSMTRPSACLDYVNEDAA